MGLLETVNIIFLIFIWWLTGRTSFRFFRSLFYISEYNLTELAIQLTHDDEPEIRKLSLQGHILLFILEAITVEEYIRHIILPGNAEVPVLIFRGLAALVLMFVLGFAGFMLLSLSLSRLSLCKEKEDEKKMLTKADIAICFAALLVVVSPFFAGLFF